MIGPHSPQAMDARRFQNTRRTLAMEAAREPLPALARVAFSIIVPPLFANAKNGPPGPANYLRWTQPRFSLLVIKLRCGDLQVGYFNLDMVFDGVSMSARHRKQLRSVTNRKKTEVLYDEIDVAGRGTFEYRFICWPEGEVSIRFRDFSYRKTPAKSPKFRAANPRFRLARKSKPITD